MHILQTTLDDILANIRIVECLGTTGAGTLAALETSLLTLGAPPPTSPARLWIALPAEQRRGAGTVGAHCPAVEQEAVAMCCIQAALHPPSRGMARAMLEHTGARMGYPCLPAYMAYHFLPLVYNWMLHSHLDLPTLLSIRVTPPPAMPIMHLPSHATCKLPSLPQDIVTTAPAAADEAAFLKEHCSSLVPCLVFKHARAAQGLQYHAGSLNAREEHRLRAIIRQASEELDRISDSLGEALTAAVAAGAAGFCGDQEVCSQACPR